MQADQIEVNRENLETIAALEFDTETFKSVDPCGIVYELAAHTSRQLDIELGGLLTAMISWGNRKCIRKAAHHMLADEMQWSPSTFILEQRYQGSYGNGAMGNCCVYRTLNREAFIAVCDNLHAVLTAEQDRRGRRDITLEECLEGLPAREAIGRMAEWLAPAKMGVMGRSACKRICMFMRWMVRTAAPDFGLWKSRPASDLYAVLDVHVCTLAAPLMKRKQASWAACEELTSVFRQWDPADPLKYDIALMVLADMQAKENSKQVAK